MTQRTAFRFVGGCAGLERSWGALAGRGEVSVPAPHGPCVSASSCPGGFRYQRQGPAEDARDGPRAGCSAASSPLGAGRGHFPSSSTFTDCSSQGKAVTAPRGVAWGQEGGMWFAPPLRVGFLPASCSDPSCPHLWLCLSSTFCGCPSPAAGSTRRSLGGSPGAQPG